jgi:cystathionine beta-lyase
MKFDFDSEIPRSGTNCVKYDLRGQIFGREDVIPMWVADMDFAAPPFVADALRKRVEHPVYGYSIIPDSYFQSIIEWHKRRYGWEIKKDWIQFSPGVVTGLNVIVQALTDPGDKIIVQPPVYHRF